jgi:hypothetical protein
MVRRLVILVLAVASTACTSVGRVEQGAALAPSANQTIFIIGVKPDNYRVSVFSGSVNEGVFRQNQLLPATFYGASEGGYVVGKTGSTGALAITNVRVVSSEKSILGMDFAPCGDAKTVVFSLPKGRVVYLGNLAYDFSGNGLRIFESTDLEAARQHLRTGYPQLADSLEQGRYEVLPTSASCSQSITIPIYLPR